MTASIKCLVLIAICATAALGAATADDAPVGALQPCVTLTGSDSRITERSYHRIQTLEDWCTLWQRHKGLSTDTPYDLYYDPAGLPIVDFDRFMVIAIFQGTGVNSAGLKPVSLTNDAEQIVLRFDDKSFQTMGPDGGGRTATVYGFFVIPKSAKPVMLEENVQGMLGRAPVWKNRANLSAP